MILLNNIIKLVGIVEIKKQNIYLGLLAIIRKAGPEIVLVDVETYKMYNNKKEMSLLINACFYDATQIESDKIIINISWKGYLYVKTFNHLPYNVGCCENLLFKVIIDLETNFIKNIEQVYYIPLVSTFSVVGKSDFNLSIGYIKVLESDIDKLPKNPLKINNKTFKFYPEFANLDFNFNFIVNKILNTYEISYEDKIFKLNDIISEQYALNWDEKINLNYKDLKNIYNVFFITQCFINIKN